MIALLSGLPMPPSSNNCYVTIKKTGGRFPSKELKAFKADMEAWRLTNLMLVDEIRRALVAPRISDQQPLIVRRYFCFPREKVMTLAGLPQKLDASNRTKSLDDAVFEILRLDDRWIFEGSDHKVIGPREEVHVTLGPGRLLPPAPRLLERDQHGRPVLLSLHGA